MLGKQAVPTILALGKLVTSPFMTVAPCICRRRYPCVVPMLRVYTLF